MTERPRPEVERRSTDQRDALNITRTILTNERTFLAYVRTALTLFAVGVSFVKFFDHPVVEVVGWMFIPSEIIVLIVGPVRYLSLRRVIGSC